MFMQTVMLLARGRGLDTCAQEFWSAYPRTMGEFLGLGDPSVVSWGTNLYWASNDGALPSGYWWVFIPSGLCIALVAFALSLINYGVDEVSNPRLRSSRRRRTSPIRATEVSR